MKKLLKGAITTLLLAGLIFTGCDPNPTPENPSDNNGQQNTEQTDKPVTKPSQSDKDDKTDNSSTDKKDESTTDKKDDSSSTDKENKGETTEDKNESEDKNQGQTPEDETNNEQDNSNPEDTVTGAAVTNFTATKGDTTVTLNWTNPTTGTLSSVKIYTGTTSSPATLVATITDKSTSYVVTGLVNNTNYYFKAVTTFSDDQNEYSSNVISATPRDSSDLVNISSVDFAKKLIIGWNLGNTLDAGGTGSGDYQNGLNTETSWGMPKTTKEMIEEVHKKGFETIRVPVSWHNHISKTDTTNYKIDDNWMARVKEIVDYAYNDGMYVIINIHHDNMSIDDISSHPGFAISEDTVIQTKSKNYISKVWTQIATEFADYDNHLIFEILNEPRDMGGLAFSNGGENTEFGPSSTNAAKMNPIITAYEKTGLDEIRKIAGNENRFVMVPAYAASTGYLDTYTLPVDTATDKLLLSTHAYSPYEFAMGSADDKTFTDSHKASLDSMFNALKKDYTAKGIGVVMGEASATDKGNTTERENWSTYYFTKAAKAGISVILWDNAVVYPDGSDDAERHGWFNRTDLSWHYPTIISKMIAAAKTPTDLSDIVDCGLLDSVIECNASWSGSGVVSNTKFISASDTTKLKLTIVSTGSGSTLKMQDKWGDDCTILSAGTVVSGGTKYTDTFNVSTGTFIYQPSSNEWTKIKENGLVIYGKSINVSKLEIE